MKILTLLLAFCGCALALHADETTASVKLSRPGQPAVLKIRLPQGQLHVTPGDSPDIIAVKSTAAKPATTTRDDGLRVLGDTTTGFTLTEADNTAVLNYGGNSPWPTGNGAAFTITAPTSTALEIDTGWGGAVTIERMTGSVAIKGMNTPVQLVDLGGGVLVESMNGEINASFTTLPEKAPLSFSSMHGAITLRLPAEARANVRLRSHNGAILTDFPETALQTKTENLGRTDWGAFAGQHIAIVTQVARDIAHEVSAAAKSAAKEVKTAVDETTRPAAPAAPTPPTPPVPPAPPHIPAIAGGKVVSGTLNGGGTDIQITTMNGDITLRKR